MSSGSENNSSKANSMFNGASPILFELAKNLRKNMTDAENLLWFNLKSGINGYKFRRQHPLGLYIADFYCHKLKLIIEIDGNIHNRPEVRQRDMKRSKELIAWGYTIVRFSNDEILRSTESVLLNIQNIVKQQSEKIKL